MIKKDVKANTRLRHHIYGIWGTIGAGGIVATLAAAKEWFKNL